MMENESALRHNGMTDGEYRCYCMGLSRGFCEGRKAGAELAAEMYALRNVAIQIVLKPGDLGFDKAAAMLTAREEAKDGK